MVKDMGIREIKKSKYEKSLSSLLIEKAWGIARGRHTMKVDMLSEVKEGVLFGLMSCFCYLVTYKFWWVFHFVWAYVENKK